MKKRKAENNSPFGDETTKKLKEIEDRMTLESRMGDLDRARSITIGTALGGATEISMRGNGRNLWILMNPVEVIELIHQLSANVGCHLALKPREDFSSWREWRIPDAEKKRLNGWSPWSSDPNLFALVGKSGHDEEKARQFFEEWLKLKDYSEIDDPNYEGILKGMSIGGEGGKTSDDMDGKSPRIAGKVKKTSSKKKITNSKLESKMLNKEDIK